MMLALKLAISYMIFVIFKLALIVAADYGIYFVAFYRPNEIQQMSDSSFHSWIWLHIAVDLIGNLLFFSFWVIYWVLNNRNISERQESQQRHQTTEL